MEGALWNREYLKAWSANFMLFFSFMLVVPLLPIYLSERFNATADVIGVVLSGYTWVALLSRAGSGFLVDNLPRKRVLLVAWFLLFTFFAGYIVAGSLLLFALVRTLHGGPFGAATVANSTVAIDLLPASRRAEGIGYYGLSNNLATAISPTIGLWLYETTHNFDLLFAASMFVAFLGFVINSRIHMPAEANAYRARIQLSRQLVRPGNYILVKAWPVFLNQACYAFAYMIVATYLAIYGVHNPSGTGNSGLFFTVLSSGLIISRLTGSKSLRQGQVWQNAAKGVCVSAIGFVLFAAVHQPWAYYATAFIVGLGNGHMFPAFQSMFINLTSAARRGVANSTQLTAWDVGVGLGTILGGALARNISYEAAFWLAAFGQVLGAFTFLLWIKNFYIKNQIKSQ